MMFRQFGFHPLTSLILATFVLGCHSSFLRSGVDRHLQSNVTGASDSSEMIQAVLSDALPDTNFALRKALEDPLLLDLDQSVPIDCGNLALSMDFEKLTGLSTINVDSITVKSGSDSVTENCNVLEAWRTAADVAISFSSNLASGNIRSRVYGTCNGVYYDQPLTTSVVASGVAYSGVANLKGTFNAVTDTIGDTEVLGTLALTTNSIVASVGLLPDALAASPPLS